MTIAKRRVFTTVSVIILSLACMVMGNSFDPPLILTPQSSPTVRPATVTLNADPFGTTDDLAPLSEKLRKIFAERLTYHAYAVGMETRVDLPESDRIERTVTVDADRTVDVEVITNVIEALLDAGASPVVFPIRTGAANLAKLKPNPLTLMVRLKDSQTDSSKANQQSSASGWDVATSSIAVNITTTHASDSLATLDISTEDDFTIEGKRIAKAALQQEFRDRAKMKPGKKAISVTVRPSVPFRVLEDIYQAAFAAGLKRVDLERLINWDNKKSVTATAAELVLTVPAELKEEVSSQPNKNGDVTWTVHYFTWTKRRVPLEVDVIVTNWDKDFPPEAGGGSPEELLAQRYAATQQEKSAGAPIEELSYLEVGGVKGILFRAGQLDDHNKVWLSWQTLRYHKGKAQQLSISVRGIRSDLDKLMNVISSASFVSRT